MGFKYKPFKIRPIGINRYCPNPTNNIILREQGRGSLVNLQNTIREKVSQLDGHIPKGYSSREDLERALLHAQTHARDNSGESKLLSYLNQDKGLEQLPPEARVAEQIARALERYWKKQQKP